MLIIIVIQICRLRQASSRTTCCNFYHLWHNIFVAVSGLSSGTFDRNLNTYLLSEDRGLLHSPFAELNVRYLAIRCVHITV